MKFLSTFSVLLFLFFSTHPVVGQEEKSTADPNDFTFIVAGHVYGAPGVINKPFHPPFMDALGDVLKEDTLDFMVLTGDIVQESDEKSWDRVDKYLDKVGVPTLFAPGNHDLKDRKLYISRYGSTSYIFDIGNNLIVVMDVLNTGWNVDPAVLKEMHRKCDESRYENILIFSHHIFWQDEKYTPELKPNSMYGRLDSLNFYSRVLPVLGSLRGNVFIYGGDVGALANGSELALHRKGKVRMIASGMGGEKWDNMIKVMVKNDIVENEIIYLQGHPSIQLKDSMFTNIEVDD